jgi:hypothetical protein
MFRIVILILMYHRHKPIDLIYRTYHQVSIEKMIPFNDK